MRLFYIIILFISLISFAGFASPKKSNASRILPVQITAISPKISLQLHTGIQPDGESLQKDIINHALTKILLDAFVVLTLSFSFSLFVNRNNTVLRRLKYHYGCLLNMLYPKHAFW